MSIILICHRYVFQYVRDYLDVIGLSSHVILYLPEQPLSQIPINDKNMYIFIQKIPSCIYAKLQSVKENVYILNTEQTSRPDIEKQIKIDCSHFNLIDYSKCNIRYVHDNLNIPSSKCVHIPYRYQQNEVDKLKVFCQLKTYDVAICGCDGPYRAHINAQLAKEGITVKNVIGWKDVRDKQIGQARILLNVHYAQSYKVYEHLRCDRFIFAGQIIVSEDSLNQEDLDIKDLVYFEPYDSIVTKVKEILKDYDRFQKDHNERLSLKIDEIRVSRDKKIEDFLKDHKDRLSLK
jgi:hypothetical protein